MKSFFADLYGLVILFIVFFTLYITNGDYKQRVLRTGMIGGRESYLKMVDRELPVGVELVDPPKIWPDGYIQGRKSRLTKSMVLRKYMSTTTEKWTRRNRTSDNLKFHPATNIRDLYTLRKQHLQRACSIQGTPQPLTYNSTKIQDTLLVERKHSILFCNIPKVSSSFWKRTLTVMKGGGQFSSPFEVTLAQSALPSFHSVRKRMNSSEMEHFMNKVSSFIFVRDPYARLFSGYVNKIYCPNEYYWKSMGTKIAKATRRIPSEMSLKYGHDIKFSEFIKFIVKFTEKGYKLDMHFAPMNSKCNPCRMPYDFIGKLESFHRDAEYLLQDWRHKFNDFNISFNDFEKESALDTADLHIKLMFTTWNIIQETGYPLYYMALRVWSDLQIRGYLSKTIPFPFHPSEAVYITKESFMVAIRNALNKPVNKLRVKEQREEALIQAYRTVPLRYMEKLRKFLLKDCQLFGYDDRPVKLFDRKMPFKVEHKYLAGL